MSGRPERPGGERLPAEGQRVYFCHLVKTAGTTLRTWLETCWPPADVFPARTWAEMVELPPTRLLDTRLVAGHFGGRFLRFFPEPLETLTMVRDPIDRALSRHGQLLAEPEDGLHEFATRDASTVNALLSSERGRLLSTNRQVKDLGLTDIAPDVARYWEEGNPGPPYGAVPRPPVPFPSYDELLERSLAVLGACRWVGVVERFDESVSLLAHALGVPDPGPLRPENVGTHRVAREAIGDDELEALEKLNRHDQILHRRACQLVDSRWRARVRDARAEWCAAVLEPRSRALVESAELEPIRATTPLPVDRAELGALAAAIRAPAGSRVTVEVRAPASPTALELVVNGRSVDAEWRQAPVGAVATAVLPLAPASAWVELAVRRRDGVPGDGASVCDPLSARVDAPAPGQRR